jgi:cytochrome c peroxidase
MSWVCALASAALALSTGGAAPGQRTSEPLPAAGLLGLPPRAPADDPGAAAVVALGARLFEDPLLSSDASIACVSCHRPALGFADEARFSRGAHGRTTARNTPTLLNRAFGTRFMWDGRAASLEEQVLLPIENPLEMDLPLEQALARLDADPRYRAEFEAALGAPPTRAGLARALAAFVREQVLGDSPVDRFRAGAFEELGDAERAGLWFFESRGGCWRCHSGANFSDEDFHNTGVGADSGTSDAGRAAVTGAPEDHGRFKTPTLRGVALTAPYMHDGSLATLAEVVEFYRGGGRANANLDPLLAPLDMDERDAANLVAFLRALSARGPR